MSRFLEIRIYVKDEVDDDTLNDIGMTMQLEFPVEFEQITGKDNVTDITFEIKEDYK